MQPITSKAQMYRLLRAGGLGNTLRSWASPTEVPRDEPGLRCGLRCLEPGCPFWYGLTAAAACRAWQPGYLISEMFPDQFTTLNAELMDAAGGLVLHWRDEVGESCRDAARRGWHLATGLVASTLLRARLTEASYHDIRALLEAYPDHVVELSAASVMVGSWPGRNHIVWECRLY